MHHVIRSSVHYDRHSSAYGGPPGYNKPGSLRSTRTKHTKMAGLKGSIILTGSNGGLGSAIVSSILKSAHAPQYRGLYTVRNPSTASSLQSVLRNGSPSHKSELCMYSIAFYFCVVIVIDMSWCHLICPV